MKAIVRSAILLLLLSQSALSASQDGSGAQKSQPIPERLRYLFDLEWCKQWEFTCLRCERRGDSIACIRLQRDCEEAFGSFKCARVDIPLECSEWTDGCNLCRRGEGEVSCTRSVCIPHHAEFKCLVDHPE
jgi:hypothetical protein